MTELCALSRAERGTIMTPIRDEIVVGFVTKLDALSRGIG